jgi:aspartate-semialdehyde dehydrogenase
MTGKTYGVAVVGATGMVGERMRSILEERSFPLAWIRFLASERSLGRTVRFRGEEFPVEVLTANSFAGVDFALFSAGAAVSREFAPAAVRAGAVCIDNTSAFRMDPDVPLVVPEVNPHDLTWQKGIIANPNCSTIQMVVVLKPLHDAARIKRVVVSTFQSVSGAGKRALDEMLHQTRELLEGREVTPKVFHRQIGFNCLPHIDVFLENGYTKEEMKMVNETKKIMGDQGIAVTATCVRVPVRIGHSESVNVETERPLAPAEAMALLAKAPGVTVLDDPASLLYPTALDAAGKDATLVGRIRRDESLPNALNLWIVSDNLRKGAALNAVQIAEEMIARGLR